MLRVAFLVDDGIKINGPRACIDDRRASNPERIYVTAR
jgi:hypothetical protein